MAALGRPECLDFLQFQDTLKKMRELDDKIIYTLNVHLPTESFKGQTDSTGACKDLFGQLKQNFQKRQDAINQCIKFTKEQILVLKNQKDLNNEDQNIMKALRKEQSKLKFLQTELGVEEVVTDKTSKVIYEKCRQHYVPPDFNI